MTDSGVRDTQIAVLAYQVEHLAEEVVSLTKTVKDDCVSKSRYLPVEMIVYGGVGLMLTALFGAMILSIIKAS